MSLRAARPLAALPALLLAAALLVAGCDSDDDGGMSATQTTVQFAGTNVSVSEEDSVEVEVPVTISNPTGEAVTAEVLFASASSTADFADLNLTELNAEGIYGSDTTGYVVETISFEPDAEDGDTLTASFSITDSTFEREETARFALQNVSGAEPGSATTATIGSPREFSLVIEGEGTETFLSEDFSDETLDPLVAISVASNQNWGVSSAGGADNVPYAIANGFGGDEPSNDWLITPEGYDFGPFDTVTLTFLNATNFDDGGLEVDEALRLKVSTDYDGEGNPEDFNWTDVSDRIDNYSGGGYEFVEATVDLSDFSGDDVYVAFQYISTGTGGGSSEAWEVDSIELVGAVEVPGE